MGKIYVVGIGPGNEEFMTAKAIEALNKSDVIAGYKTYIDLIKDRYPEKTFFSNGMRQEIERCEECVRLSKEGKTVSLVCSGDSGVYGMASLLLTIAGERDFDDVEVVCGITAALSGAAVLGAPIGHDFCVISLSDLLTPRELIEKRLMAAAMGDMCIVLYNPSSHKREDYLQRACDILLKTLSSDIRCGYVRNIGREGEMSKTLTLGELRDEQVYMFTTVFIGNSKTKMINGRMVTPRGYKLSE